MSKVTVIPGKKSTDDGVHVAPGTKVMLDDGTEIEGVISVKLEADAGGIWQATIVCYPKQVHITKALAEQIVYKQHNIDNISSHIDEQGKIFFQADVTTLADSFARKFENVEIS